MAYLDHAATTPIRPVALNAWVDRANVVGNASSAHACGRAARRVLEEARESVADSLGVEARHVIFTSGGTESNNFGIIGTYLARNRKRPGRRVVIASEIEHKSVSETVRTLGRFGAVVETVGTDRTGRVDLGRLQALLDQHADVTALVAVMWANNEVGTVQPIAEVSKLCRDRGVPLHCDAVQAVGSIPVRPGLAGTMSVSGHKFGGPPGTGVLVAFNEIDPIIRGGGQERGMRAGTSNVPGAVGLAAALAEAIERVDAHGHRMRELRENLIAGILELAPDAVVNSSDAGLPGIAHVTFPGCPSDAMVLLLDAAGICASAGSACSAGVAQPSPVLLAIGASPEAASQSLRFSLGWTSTPEDIEQVLGMLPDAVRRSRGDAPIGAGNR